MNDNNYQQKIEKRFELLKLSKCLYQDEEGLSNLKSSIQRLNPSCHEELERTDNSTDFFRVLEKYKIFNIDMTVKQIKDLIEVLKKFGEVKHIKEINELEIVIVSHSTSEQILMFADSIKQMDKSFQDISQEHLDVERGHDSQSSIMRISKFISKECKEYMERYFSKMKFFTFNDDDTFSITLKGFKTHLQKNKPAFLVRNYDLYDHYEFLCLENSLTQSEMTVMDYIGFEAENKFMYFIKLSNAKTLKELIRDVNTSATYLRMFALLNQNILQLTGIHLVSIIVICEEFENLRYEVSKACQLCPIYLFTKQEFSEFSMELFFKLKDNISLPDSDSGCETAIDFEKFKCEMGSLFGYMATKSGNLVPNLSKRYSTQIEQATIILYPQQVAVLNLSNKHVILQGSSGSGKTIVGKLLLKQLSSDPNNKVIYYINCGTSQELTEEMKYFVDTTIQNSNVHCCSKSEFNTNSLTEMLQLIASKHEDVETVHVILEEVALDELNKKEILAVSKLLENSKFKDGHFKIICQTMWKERKVLKNGVEVSSSNRNQIDLLQSEADFKLDILSKSVRNTVAIFKLVNIAIEILEKESNSFALDLFEDETAVKRQTKDDNAKKESEMTSENDTIPSDQCLDLLDNDQNGEVSAKKQDTGMSNIPDNLDAYFKYMDKPNKNAISKHYLETTFHFNECDGTFHEIKGKKPVLFFPFADKDKYNNDKDKICLLTACFYQIVHKKCIPFKEHVTIIHFENEPPSLLLSSLMCLEKNIFPKKYDIKRSLDVHGLEFDNVIIYIDVGEYHMRHYFVEAITRCKANLAIIAVGTGNIKNVHNNVFLKIFQRWENFVTVFKFEDILKILQDREDIFNVLQDSYKDYISNESSQENRITEAIVMSRIEQLLASQLENKEYTGAHERNNEGPKCCSGDQRVSDTMEHEMKLLLLV